MPREGFHSLGSDQVSTFGLIIYGHQVTKSMGIPAKIKGLELAEPFSKGRVLSQKKEEEADKQSQKPCPSPAEARSKRHKRHLKRREVLPHRGSAMPY